MQSFGLMLFWLVVVLAMIPACLWLLKRSGAGGLAGNGEPRLLKTVAQLPLGPGQRVVTVEVQAGDERTWLVLGVTGQQISTLHTLVPPEGVQAPAPPALPVPPFAQMLRRVTDKLPHAGKGQ